MKVKDLLVSVANIVVPFGTAYLYEVKFHTEIAFLTSLMYRRSGRLNFFLEAIFLQLII